MDRVKDRYSDYIGLDARRALARYRRRRAAVTAVYAAVAFAAGVAAALRWNLAAEVAVIAALGLFYWLGLALLIWQYYRMFSRNIPARTAEHYKFYTIKGNIQGWLRQKRTQWNNRKIYHYYTCPQCRQKLRVPRGRGRIQISCPRCGTQFIKKS